MAGAGSGSQGAGLVVGLVIGGVVLIAVIGILAAIAIPNLLTATQRSKQKRTTTDLRSISTAIEAYATDNNKYPSGTTVGELTAALSPLYIRTLPTVDGWGTPIRYECWPAETCTSYALGSAARDKVFEHESLQEYRAGTKTENFDSDLVYANGKFVQHPDAAQAGGQ